MALPCLPSALVLTRDCTWYQPGEEEEEEEAPGSFDSRASFSSSLRSVILSATRMDGWIDGCGGRAAGGEQEDSWEGGRGRGVSGL